MATQTRVPSHMPVDPLSGALAVAVYAVDAHGTITYFNQKAAELWGREPEIGVEQWSGSLRLYHRDGRPMRHEECPMAIALAQRRELQGEAIAERPDGTRIPFIAYPAPIFDANGDLTGGVNVLIDDTERHRATVALRKREEHMRAVFRAPVSGIIEVDRDNIFRVVNDQFCEIVGRTREELMSGMSCHDVTHADDRYRMQECLDKLANGAADSFSIEKRYVRPDGEIVWAHNGVSAVRDENGALTSAVAVVIDITDLIRTTEELADANAKKDEFLSLVSHELRTPITTILGNARVLARLGPALTDDQRTEALHDMRAESERLNRIVDNLLTLARLERGQTPPLEPVMVPRVVEHAVGVHREDAFLHDYRLRVTGDGLVAEANEPYVDQITRNLLTNAERYAPAGSAVDIVVERRGSDIVVSVEDTGIVDPADIERIFEVFHRSRRTDRQPGLGVGLSVSRRLAAVMDGHLWVESDAVGGVRFAFSLPSVDPATP